MDTGALRARERGWKFWKALTTGKSVSLGGIPRPVGWFGWGTWVTWFVTQSCQYLTVLIALVSHGIAFFSVPRTLGPCLVEEGGLAALDLYAMSTFPAQPVVLSKLTTKSPSSPSATMAASFPSSRLMTSSQHCAVFDMTRFDV